jgi:hypothetical protein
VKVVFVERALYDWFAEEYDQPEGFGDEVHLHRPGAAFPDRTERIVFPRIVSIERAVGVRPRRGEEHDQVTIQVGVHVKNPAGGREDLEELSRLVDKVRNVVDATERAGAAKILDDENRVVGIVDFGPASETRSYNDSVSIGGITLPGVDSAVLTVTCEVSPVKPRVVPLSQEDRT